MAEQTPEPYSRLDNGTRARHDGKGDGWANLHRSALGRNNYLHDVDGLCGIEAFASNTADRFFLEYEPDNYTNRLNEIRDFAVVALFDRKSTESAAFSDESRLSRSLYLWQCRVFARYQPTPPRFFIVIGGQEPPWALHEIDIQTGERIGLPQYVDGENFGRLWRAIGLIALRDELRKWISPQNRIATDEAALAEIERKLRNPDLDANTRANLEAQASAARIRINTARNRQ